jgi:hypothetical protein
MVVDRAPAVLGTRERAVDRYRGVIERYDVSSLRAAEPLPNRDRVIDGLVRELRPLLDAIVEVEESEAVLAQLRGTIAEYGGTMLAQVASGRLIRATERRELAGERVRELVRREETILRYALLRHLVRARPSRA